MRTDRYSDYCPIRKVCTRVSVFAGHQREEEEEEEEITFLRVKEYQEHLGLSSFLFEMSFSFCSC